MKRIVAILTFLLSIASIAIAQDAPFFRNDGALSAIGNPNKSASVASVDANGRVFMIPTGASGATVDSIPISTNPGLNGYGSGNIGWYSIAQASTAAGSTSTVINSSGIAALNVRPGDILMFTTGSSNNIIKSWSYITAVATNSVTLAWPTPALDTGGNNIDILRPVPITANNSTASHGLTSLFITPFAGATGGSLTASAISAASVNSTLVKASQGNVYSVQACATVATQKFVRLYNKATAPTCGTDTPVLRYTVPASGCVVHDFPVGDLFPLGIGYCITNLAPDSDATAVAASDVLLNVSYF